MKPVKLRCEYLERPIGIDIREPRFSWIFENSRRAMKQESYRILVASNPAELARNQADKWDSGRIFSDRNVNISYEGSELSSGEACYWKVGIWIEGEQEAVFSDPSTFEMGLLDKSDWKAEWISAVKQYSAPAFRREFSVSDAMKHARVYVSGLGYYELSLNGQRVGDHVLDPAPTYYHNDIKAEMHSRILYSTYDVTEYLKDGENVLGCLLGNGWYSGESDVGSKMDFRAPFADRPVLILQIEIEYEGGRKAFIATDTNWKVSSSPIVYNDFCHGEQYDARLEKTGWDEVGFDDSEWDAAVAASAPDGELCAQMLPASRIMKRMKPVSVTAVGEGIYMYDFGQHFSGWTRLKVNGHLGEKVVLRHAGRTYYDGTLDTRNNWGGRQSDSYILKGDGDEVWEPKFTLHGFQYVEVTGFPGKPELDNLEACVVYTSVKSESTFACSSGLINKIHENVWWTLMTSFQGMPQDAAERTERVAWTGDPGSVVEDYFLNFDSASFWTKWLTDISDSQNKKDGRLPLISPVFGWRSVDKLYTTWPYWNGTYPIYVWKLYEYYDDTRILEQHYPGIRKLVDHFTSVAENGIISDGLGDHMEPQDEKTSFNPVHTPAQVTSTAYYYFSSWIVSRAAEVLEKKKDTAKYLKLSGDIRDAFIREFFDEKTAQYATGSQTSNALALLFDLVPEGRQNDVLKNLVNDIRVKHKGHLSTGIIGTAALNLVLPSMGRSEVMHEIITQKDWPGWGYEIDNGATTVWECFDLDAFHSLNMKMFCSTDKYCYGSLAGIWPLEPGFRKARIRPAPVSDISFVAATVATIRGQFSVDWKRDSSSLSAKITIPGNCSGEVHIPTLQLKEVDITESGSTLVKCGEPANEMASGGMTGITFVAESDGYFVFEVGSGSYEFALSGNA